MLIKRTILFLILGVSCAMCFLFSSCTRTNGVIIGLIADFEGPSSQIGKEIYQNIQLFLKKTNHSPFKVVALSVSKVDEVTNRFQQLYDQGIRIFIIGLTSQGIEALITGKDTRDCIIFNLLGASGKFSGIDDSLIRLVPDTRQESLAVGGYINTRFPGKSTLVVYDTGNSAYTLPALNTLTNTLTGGVSVIGLEVGSFNEKSFTAELSKYRPDNVYLLIGGDHINTAGTITRFTKSAYPDCNLIAAPWLNSSVYIENSAHASEGVILPTLLPNSGSNYALQAYNENFDRYYHTYPQAVHSCFAFEVMEILNKCAGHGANTPSQIKSYILLTSKFDTLIGPVVFDQYGDVLRNYYFLKINDGHIYYEE
ncbi:MAG: ABC transporter substrate-binding protein [Brevinematales bacterium]|nr:ABC transporter substrate-binding protein [Brevinematales bacterium]